MTLQQYERCKHLGTTVEGKNVATFIRWIRPGAKDAVEQRPGVCPQCQRAGR